MGLLVFAIAIAVSQAFTHGWYPEVVSEVAVLAIVGVLSLGHRARRRRLVIDDGGVEEWRMFGHARIEWIDVAYYHYSSAFDEGAHGVAKLHAGVQVAQRIMDLSNHEYGALTIVGHSGARVQLHGLRYLEPVPALLFAFDQLHTRLRARPRDYAPYGMTATEVSCEGRSLAIGSIDHVDFWYGKLRIHARDKHLAWASVTTSQVHNSMLFIEELQARGIEVRGELRATVPPLRPDLAGSRPDALPTAQVVQR